VPIGEPSPSSGWSKDGGSGVSPDGLPMQRIRRALEVLAHQGELDHDLASSQLYSDGANVLYD
jgi:hypothetical protein